MELDLDPDPVTFPYDASRQILISIVAGSQKICVSDPDSCKRQLDPDPETYLDGVPALA